MEVFTEVDVENRVVVIAAAATLLLVNALRTRATPATWVMAETMLMMCTILNDYVTE